MGAKRMDRFFQRLADWQNKPIAEVLAEWHSAWCGFAVGFTVQGHNFPMTVATEAELEKEEHWFHTGRWVGRAVLIASIGGIITAVTKGCL